MQLGRALPCLVLGAFVVTQLGAQTALVQPPVIDQSFWDIWKSGGATMYFILLLSLMAGATAIERLVNFRRSRIVPDQLAQEADTLWQQDSFAGIEALCRQQQSTLGRILAFVVQNRHQSLRTLSDSAGDRASTELKRHQQKAYPLAIVATLSPLAGLFGTVLGMIESFRMVAHAGSLGDASILAGGISQALTTTAAGLLVALPALGLYHYFRNQTALQGILLEEQVNDLLARWFLSGQDRCAD
jgi:biopolymer transport protein ExbB